MSKLRRWGLTPLLMIVLLLEVVSCASTTTKTTSIDDLHKPTNSIYYWRTVFNPSEDELAFLKKNNVGRMYLRMFDVVNQYYNYENRPIPNATVVFKQKMPDSLEIVPTVFITVDAIRYMDGDDAISTLASKIVDRIDHICSWNDVENWHEIQLDCDWTQQTRDKFFRLCEKVREKLPKDKLLSSTIRLHQLRQSAPPVDYGVLMVYNTDDFHNPDTENSILNDNTVELYLSKRKEDFNLPLDIALPIYQWYLVFDKEGRFKRISSEKSESLDTDEEIKFESVPYETIEKTQSLLNKHLNLQKGCHSTILYHLSDKNIKNYSDEQIENIYNN